ncbi:MAG: undecaprenyl-diphosphate phosphatase [Spirochaetaceae bacterium]|nr:undecaprenyl-diphosphate phosphatase [Spirochaetaceae bacterium]
MTVIQAIVLGAVQGITEFLPVSSSGHLVLLQRLLKIDEPPLLFDTMVHVGTLGAVVIVLWEEVLALLKKPWQKQTLLLVIATLPTVGAALLFNDVIEAAFRGGALLGPAFLFTAVALTVAELLPIRAGAPPEKRPREKMNLLDAVVIGVCQSVAILPAVSRSGLTLSGSLLRNIDREDAARFSFLLSIPAILGALVLQLAGFSDGVSETGGLSLAVGTLTAFLSGLLAIRLMLKIVREKRLFGFAAYTAVLGILCIVLGKHLG